MLQREMPDFIPPCRDVATQFARFESGGLQHLGYPSREGPPFADPWCEGVERTSAERVEAAGPHHHHHHHHSSDSAMTYSRLNARVTWTVDILNIIVSVWLSAVFVCFINIGFCKCDRYKHVQSANIVWDVLLLCLTLSHGMVAT